MNVSSSKINDLLQCSLSFYYKHVLKLPDRTHPKTHQGSCVHNIVEFVLKPKRLPLLRGVMEHGLSFDRFPSLGRYARTYGRFHSLDGFPIQDIETMAALAFDTIKPYILASWEAGEPTYRSEQRFELKIANAICTGFIDFWVTAKPGRIIDFKTKGKRYTAKELPNLVQAHIYQMYHYIATGELVPVDFIMLRFPPTQRRPDYHIQTVAAPTEMQIEGMKAYVCHLYEVMNTFTFEDAYVSPCSDRGFCDRVCPFRNPFQYLSIRKRGTNELVGNFPLDTKRQVQQDEWSEVKLFSGCIKFNT